jgi:hypothetical protein
MACVLVLLLVLVAGTPNCAADVRPKIDSETARRLAAEAYDWKLKYTEYDHDERLFMIIAPLGGEYATAPVSWLAVNPWTGDVWDLWRCRRLSTALLRKSQAAIRRSFRRKELPQYARLRALRPVCYGP